MDITALFDFSYAFYGANWVAMAKSSDHGSGDGEHRTQFHMGDEGK
jgi:hypothetical protein